MQRPMTAAMALTVLALAGAAVAEEKANPNGTFTWKYSNQTAVHTLKLKLDGEKLTGSIKSFQSAPESPIEDATYKDGIVTFKHTYKGRDGQKIVASYAGTVTEDGIKGMIEIKHPERTNSIKWDSKRVETPP